MNPTTFKIKTCVSCPFLHVGLDEIYCIHPDLDFANDLTEFDINNERHPSCPKTPILIEFE